MENRPDMSLDVTVVRNGRLVLADGIIDGDLTLSGGVIAQVGGKADQAPDSRVIDASGCYVLPGFVDLHVHGGAGFDLTGGLFDPARARFDPRDERYPEMLPKVAAHFARHGVTYALLATVASPERRLAKVLGLLADYIESGRNAADGCRIGGAFIEGTWVKEAAFSGAQNPENFCEPSLDLFERLNQAARGHIRYAMIAPEWGQSAMRLIAELSQRGVLVGAGHTAATAESYVEAVRNGLRMAVHLTNGPTGTSFKPFQGGGALEAALTCPEVTAELIVDGFHVNPAYVLDIMKRKGPDRVCLITDAMFAAGAEGVAEFEIERVRGAMSPNRRYLCVVGKPNTLFGSVLTTDVGFCNVVNWLTVDHAGIWTETHSAMPLDRAVLLAGRCASRNPARVLGLLEPGRAGRGLSDCLGSLDPGKRADVVVMALHGVPGRFSPEVRHVLVGGREIGPP